MAMDIIRKQRRIIAILCALALVLLMLNVCQYKKYQRMHDCENKEAVIQTSVVWADQAECRRKKNEDIRLHTSRTKPIPGNVQFHERRKHIV